jgi:prolyl 4-hydroxylase
MRIQRSCSSLNHLFLLIPKKKMRFVVLLFVEALVVLMVAGDSTGDSTCTAERARKQVLSWAPRLVHLPQFWNATVCDHIKMYAKANSTEIPSTTDTSGVHMDAIRRSSSFWLDRRQEYGPLADPMVRAAAMMVHEEVMLAPYHGEELQVTRYKEGDYYEFHHDTDDKMASMITFLVYLNDVSSGGETIFPFIKNPQFNDSRGDDEPLPPPVDPRRPGAPVASMAPYCASDRYLKIKPRKGDAILLYNIAPSLVLDQSAWHAGCPVGSGSGEKWIAQKWVEWQTVHNGKQYKRFVEGNRKIAELFDD